MKRKYGARNARTPDLSYCEHFFCPKTSGSQHSVTRLTNFNICICGHLAGLFFVAPPDNFWPNSDDNFLSHGLVISEGCGMAIHPSKEGQFGELLIRLRHMGAPKARGPTHAGNLGFSTDDT